MKNDRPLMRPVFGPRTWVAIFHVGHATWFELAGPEMVCKPVLRGALTGVLVRTHSGVLSTISCPSLACRSETFYGSDVLKVKTREEEGKELRGFCAGVYWMECTDLCFASSFKSVQFRTGLGRSPLTCGTSSRTFALEIRPGAEHSISSFGCYGGERCSQRTYALTS
jgi:hypothetical protein